jgi:hypothetical protein
MTMTSDSLSRNFRAWRRNPVFVLIWALPAAAVIAGVATLLIALEDADRALPASYHWEGARLDEDFVRARRAAQLGVAASFDLSAASGRCTVTLTPAVDADALELRLTHGSDAGLDRMMRLTRAGDVAGAYHTPCTPAPRGRWRVALADAAGSWALRGAADGPLTSFELRARAPEGPGS